MFFYLIIKEQYIEVTVTLYKDFDLKEHKISNKIFK